MFFEHTYRYRKVMLLFLVVFIVTLFLLLSEYGASKISKIALQDDLNDLEILLNSTDYLWRPEYKFRNDFYPDDPSRLEKQRKWTRQFSNTTQFKFFKPKTIFVEYVKNVYKVDLNDPCGPSLPAYENKCRLIFAKPPWKDSEKELLRLIVSGVEIDAVVTVRNAWPGKPNYKLPQGVKEVVHIQEPPIHIFGADFVINQDIIATYDLYNSDIPAPYYQYEECEWEKSLDFLEPIDIQEKSKLALALISNCRSKVRLAIIKELWKYMEIHVFGGCGRRLPNCSGRASEDCLRRLGKQYRFFFAFENSNCRHYITEKFFRNALMYGMVPVVIGAHPADYALVAPPNSYILAEQFATLEDLAPHLKKLETDDELYGEYFEWRSQGRITNAPTQDLFCRVCSMIFYSHFVKPRSWPLEKLDFGGVNKCLPRDSWRWIS